MIRERITFYRHPDSFCKCFENGFYFMVLIIAPASLIHLPKPDARRILIDLYRLVRPGGLFAATVTHGVKSRLVTDGWLPGRYFSRWRKDELARAVRRAGWNILELKVITNRERKGRWLNLLAQKQG